MVKKQDRYVVNKIFTINNKLGIHARAATQFVRLANAFKSDIYVEKNGREVNGKSIMGILMLAATRGSRITVRAEGSDAREVIEAMEKLIKSKFGEGK